MCGFKRQNCGLIKKNYFYNKEILCSMRTDENYYPLKYIQHSVNWVFKLYLILFNKFWRSFFRSCEDIFLPPFSLPSLLSFSSLPFLPPLLCLICFVHHCWKLKSLTLVHARVWAMFPAGIFSCLCNNFMAKVTTQHWRNIPLRVNIQWLQEQSEKL